jgi:hypothetical protein
VSIHQLKDGFLSRGRFKKGAESFSSSNITPNRDQNISIIYEWVLIKPNYVLSLSANNIN